VIETSQRSPIASAKLAAARSVATLLRMAAFEVAHSGDYPGWKPEPASDIVRQCQAVHQEVLGQVPTLVAMHAGPGVRRDRREASGHADDLVRAAHRGRA
jgi:dipeptidase D